MFALTTDMMVLLLQCEAPDQMPHRRFKNNHSFMCKSFLKCYVSDLLYKQPPPFALLVITLRPAHAQKHQFFQFLTKRKEVSQLGRVWLSQIGVECWTQSPTSLTRRLTRKILQCLHNPVVNNWKTLRWTNCRGYLQKKEECSVCEI